MTFLSYEQVLRIHSRLIDLYGGIHGLRDAALLQSALDRAENRLFYEPETSVAALAGAIGWGLIKNHVFLDGNKRVGLAAVLAFLEVNGHRLTCDTDVSQAMVLRVAASEMDEAAWTSWITSVAKRQD